MLQKCKIKITAFLLLVNFSSYISAQSSNSQTDIGDVNLKTMATDVLMQVLPVHHSIRHAWTAGHEYYDNKNAENIIDRDAFIQATVHTLVEHELEHLPKGKYIGTGLTISKYSDLASKRFDRLYKPFDWQNVPESRSASTWEKLLLAEDRKMRIETSMNLHAVAQPHRAIHMVEGIITSYMEKLAANAKITQEQIDRIAQVTHNFVTKQAPEYIKKSYNDLISGSKDLYQYFSGKLKNSAQSTVTSVGSALNSEINNRLKNEIATINSRIDSVISTQQELRKLEAEHAQQDQIRAVQVRLEQERKLIHQAGSDVFQGFSAIANMAGDHRSAQLIQGFGSGAVKIVDNLIAINQLQAASALTRCASSATSAASALSLAGGAGGAVSALSAAQPWIGVGVGVLTIASAIMDAQGEDQPSGFDIILEEMGKLSQKLDVYHREVMHGLRAIDQHLDAQDRMMFQNFFALHQSQQNIQQAVINIAQQMQDNHASVMGGFSHMHAVMRENQQYISGDLQSLRTEQIQDLIDEALLAVEDSKLPVDKFKEYITKLFIKACNRAKEPSLTGDTIGVTSDSALLTALDKPFEVTKIWAHPVFAHINLMKNWLTKNVDYPRAEALVNPLIWIKCTEAIITLLHKKLEKRDYPPNEETKRQDIEKLQKIYQEGQRICDFFDNAARATAPDGNLMAWAGRAQSESRIPDAVKKIAHKFCDLLQELEEIIKKEITDYEQLRTKEMQKSQTDVFEAELVKLQTSVNECTQCVAYCQETVRKFQRKCWFFDSNGREAQWSGASNNFTFHTHCHSNEFGEIRNLPGRATVTGSVTSIIDPATRFTKLKSEQIESSKKISTEVISQTRLNLHVPHISPLQTMLAYPQDNKYTVILMIPATISLSWATRCEYAIEGTPNNQYFYLRGYIYDQNNTKRLVYQARKKYDEEIETLFRNAPMYKADENILHFWYGGRYPKAADVFLTVVNPTGFGLYAPKKPYVGARDNWAQTAEIMPVPNGQVLDQKYTQMSAKDRRTFASKLLVLTNPSTNSALFKIIEKLEVQLKLLQSFLVLVYNESLTYRGQFFTSLDPLFQEQKYLLKTGKALVAYLQEYAREDNNRAEITFDILDLLEQTRKSVQVIIDELVRHVRPNFNRKTQLLAHLSQLISSYQRRPIEKHELMQIGVNSTTKIRVLDQLNLFMAGHTKQRIQTIITDYLGADDQQNNYTSSVDGMYLATGNAMAISADGQFIATTHTDKKLDEVLAANKQLTESNAKLESRLLSMEAQMAQMTQLLAQLLAKK